MAIPNDISAVLDDLNPWWRTPQVRPAAAWPVRRTVHRRLLDRLAQPDEWRAQVLLGPRQVGKTTLLRQLADDLLERGWPNRNLTYFDFEDFRLSRPVAADEIDELRPPGAEPDRPQIFLLDEVHQVPRWDPWLKRAVDRRIGRIVVTDSAATLLRQAGRESGLGTWDEVILEGLTFREFAALNAGPRGSADGSAQGRKEAVDNLTGDSELLERYLALGGFPAHATSDDFPLVRDRLRNDTVDRAIRRDLEGRVADPEQVRRLFVYLVQQSGDEQNARARSDDLEVTPTTVSRWLDLLQDTFLIASLPRGATSDKAAARLRGHPKLYASDHGLVAAFAEARPDEGEVRSRIFEAVVYRHLREVARSEAAPLHYLRWANELEVDFVLETQREVVAVEVTHAVQPKPAKRRTLARAMERAGANRGVLIHGGLAAGPVDEVELVPLPRFLADPWAALLGERA